MCVNGVGNPRTRRRPDRQVRVLAKSASDLVRALSVMAFLAIGLALPASAASRVALVIGNSAYAHVPVIPNPLNDAADIGSALGRLGFSVTRLENADYSALRRGLQEFQRAASAAEIAVVFYAGHGIEVDKQNFLVPVDARLASDRDVEFEAVSLDLVIRTVEHAGKLRLVILDACRDNPFAARMERGGATRSIGRGLSRVEPSGEMLVAYAAKEGTVALDGTGRNSPYTAALLRHLEEPGLEVGLMFRKVRDAVLETTGREQEPFTYGSLSSRGAYLTEPPAAGLPAAQTAPSGAGSAAADPAVLARLRVEEELLFWDSIRDSNDPEDFRAYRGRYPGGRFEVLALNRLRRLEAAGREGVEGATASAPLESPSSGLGPEALELSLGLDLLEWRLVQVGLASLGFDPGPADGLIGRGTRGAIGRLQASRGLEATGYLDVELRKELLAEAEGNRSDWVRVRCSAIARNARRWLWFPRARSGWVLRPGRRAGTMMKVRRIVWRFRSRLRLGGLRPRAASMRVLFRRRVIRRGQHAGHTWAASGRSVRDGTGAVRASPRRTATRRSA